MDLKYLFLIFIVFPFGCKKTNTENRSTKDSNKKDWIQIQFDKQIEETGKSDSIEIYGLPLIELPNDFYNKSQIRFLSINCNESNCMKRLSPQIKKLANLETLILSKTSITELPQEICELMKLRELRILGGGQLKELPKRIGALENLEILDLWRNDLSSLPSSIFKLKKLKTLYLGENLFKSNQLEIIKTKLPNCIIRMNR